MKTQAVSGHDSDPTISPGSTQSHDKSVVTQFWQRIMLGVVLLISLCLNFYNLQKVGYGNTYYTAAVKSMLTSWHNFFFVSFDAGGFVTVDKPPLGLWLQAASAKLFGFSGFSVILPEVVAGVLSVALLYYLVRRVFGPTTGLIAALVLAITPVSIATNRDNIIDSLLVFCVLVGAWAISRAVETGRLRWLLLCAVILGLGFNIKTLEAYLVLPAFGLVYLLGAPLSWRKRILQLVLAVVVLLVVSFAWIVTVDLTPAAQRPYVGSSSTNSELNLTFGYNGLQRVLGTAFGSRSASSSASSQSAGSSGSGGPQGSSSLPAMPEGFGGGGAPQGSSAQGGMPSGFAGGRGGGNAMFASSGTENASVFRLFAQDVAGQVSWLLPLALVGLFVAAWQVWRKADSRLPRNQTQHGIMLWGGWLLVMVIYFSVAGAEHSYYLTMLAAGVAATAAIGSVALWNEYQRPGWSGWLLPAVLLITAAVQAYILSAYVDWSSWMTPLILGLSLVAAVVLVVARLTPRWRTDLLAYPAVMVGMLAILIAPAVWSVVTMQQPGGLVPAAGPASAGGMGGMGAMSSGDATLEKYLLAHQGQARFLVATSNATSASSIILDTGKAVMAWGGFLGSDPILTTKQLATMVSTGQVRFFLIMGGGGFGGGSAGIPAQMRNELPPQILQQLEKGGMPGGFGGPGGSSEISTWVTKNCHKVSTSDLPTSTGSSTAFPGAARQQLYDCSSYH